MRPILIILHIVLAIAVLVGLIRQLGTRAQDVSDIRRLADQEHEQTLRMRADLQLQQDLLAGVRLKDPYVIELLARQRSGYVRPGEFSPPPIPASSRKTGN